ncbi:hypothetical protein QUF80_13120 [Desulfococcaceae bacterium HSG8]|nr:hypothetical protein [Desulfococcaceae bacterium HSG8]
MMNTDISKAVSIAENIFQSFMKDVINNKVVRVRKERSDLLSNNSEKKWKGVDGGKRIDDRLIHLLSISGKGSPDYPDYDNVTLLDHILSVARGAMLMSIIDDVTELDDQDIPVLKRQLALVTAVAFLHDLNKDCGIKDNKELTEAIVSKKMNDYGIDEWLAKFGLTLTPAQILHLIEQAEDRTHFFHLPDKPLPREAEWAKRYVGLADKLDGAWLQKGIKGVLDRLQKQDKRIKNPVTKAWRIIDVFDPHHPFLLDELQRCISWESSLQLSIPPLIEIHKDGRLFMFVPERDHKTDKVIDSAFERFAEKLPGSLRLEIDAMGSKGVPKLIDGQPEYKELWNFLCRLSDEVRVKIFYVKKYTQEQVEDELGEMLDDVGLPLKWAGGNLCLPFSDLKDVAPDAWERFMKAAIAALLLNIPNAPDTRNKREEAFKSVIKAGRPLWLDTIKDAQSRRTLTSLWAAVHYDEDDAEFSAIWGEEGNQDGLLYQWWEGDGKKDKGLRRRIENKGKERIQEVVKHYRAVLLGKRVVADNEDAEGRCIFTDQPVPGNKKNRIKKEDKLYVKSSAFTARDGHEEGLNLKEGRIYIEPVSYVECQFRREARNILGIKHKGTGDPPVPTLISSPTTVGLFGGFAVDNQKDYVDLTSDQLTKTIVEKGNKGAISFNLNHYLSRTRIAQFELISQKAKEQFPQLRRLLQASARMGRPVHVFRGLPTPQRAFFYFDAMPAYLAELIGANELRLEQLPEAIKKIEIAEVLLNTHGLGFDILRSFASVQGRFGALCLAWCCLLDNKKSPDVRNHLKEWIRKNTEEGKMTEQDGVFVRFAQKASTIQRSFFESVSRRKQLTVFNLAFQELVNTTRGKQSDRKSVICAIAGAFEENLRRRDLYAADKWREGKSLFEGCMDVAEFFVDEVWFEALKGRIPPQSVKKTLSSIYRIALLEIYRPRYESSNGKQ